ncbi:MAG TPA: hypothetical protein VF771_02140 [Longimicrobiaceae bacterium]
MAVLAKPAKAAGMFACTDDQWTEAAQAANDVCEGASFVVDCSRPGVIVVTVVYCPPPQNGETQG